ncbi:ArsC/Spx/MgsR family protein [Candidatus Marinarcus aquaticus]|uniref:Nitrogenase-associated protein n=1 Tax=Candidatus Marinarcus aquaticus TaxID=2044504 RepID=A0A4Q0XS10_9BACT|nr:ArsC/Spx/MgsR family protein [Candidatus Marinarcus aquaticus]RXJ60042.1 hypothetical protein CRV04_03250 [Candidatus Marinarcus aquaticus]
MQFLLKPTVIFYEKTGCLGNARQKSLLKKHGVEFEVRSMLDTVWTKESLEPFFDGLEVEQIINPFAPAIKNSEITVESLSKEQAVELMIQEPILIKRPLLQINQQYFCGFDISILNAVLNIHMPIPENINTCTSSEICKSV